MNSLTKNFSRADLFRALAVALLLCAFCVAWTHVHISEQDQGYVHACLLCQWAGASACAVAPATCPPALLFSEAVLALSIPTTFLLLPDLLRSRSPPSVSFS
jgi:hypothetical protein